MLATACLISGWYSVHLGVNNHVGYPSWVQIALLATDTPGANSIGLKITAVEGESDMTSMSDSSLPGEQPKDFFIQAQKIPAGPLSCS